MPALNRMRRALTAGSAPSGLARFRNALQQQRIPGVPDTQPSAASGVVRESWDGRAVVGHPFETNALVYSCVRLRAETALSTPVVVYRGENEAESSPLAMLLDSPMPDQSWSDWLEMLWLSHDLQGNAYVLRVRADSGRLIGYAVLRPDRVRIELRDGEVVYRYRAGSEITFEADQVAHFRAVNPYNDWYGLSPLAAAGMAVAADGAMTSLLTQFVRRAGVPAGYLRSAEARSDADIKQLVESFERLATTGGTGYLQGELEYVPAAALPTPEMVEARELVETRITSAFEVPPLLVGSKTGLRLSRGRSEYEQQRRSFWQDTVRPMTVRLEGFLNRLVADDFPGYRVAFDLSQVEELNDAITTRAAVLRQLDAATSISINEKRAAAGWETLDDPAADEVPALRAPIAPALPPPQEPVEQRRNRLALPRGLQQQTPEELARLFLISQRDEAELERFRIPVQQALTKIARDASGLLGRNVFDADRLIPASADDGLVEAIRPGYRRGSERVWTLVNQWGGLGNVAVDEQALDALAERAEPRWRGINQATRNAVERAVAQAQAVEDATDAAVRRAANGAMRQAYQDRDRVIARTEAAYARNEGAAARYAASNVERVEIFDGVDYDAVCAAADGQEWTVGEYASNPLSHPNCQRYALPITE